MNEMMEQCCDSNGNLDFDMMKQSMKRCGKEEFSEEKIGMMNGFRGQQGMPDMTKMKELMEKCGCSPANGFNEEVQYLSHACGMVWRFSF